LRGDGDLFHDRGAAAMVSADPGYAAAPRSESIAQVPPELGLVFRFVILKPKRL